MSPNVIAGDDGRAVVNELQATRKQSRRTATPRAAKDGGIAARRSEAEPCCDSDGRSGAMRRFPEAPGHQQARNHQGLRGWRLPRAFGAGATPATT